MKNWRIVHGDTAPQLIDTTSSADTVYERRNVQEETIDRDGMTIHGYVYEEREFTKAEYEAMISPAQQMTMQAISGLELTVMEMSLGMME